MSKGTRYGVVLVAVAVLAVASAPHAIGDDGTADQTAAVKGAGAPLPTFEAPLVIGDASSDQALVELTAASRQALGSDFGAVLWDATTRTATVTSTRGGDLGHSAMANAEARASAAGLKVKHASVKHSDAELEGIAQRAIKSPRDFAPQLRGVPSGGVFPALGKVVLYVMPEDDPVAWRDHVAKQGLADAIEVRAATPPAPGVKAEESRTSDSPSFSGGATLTTTFNGNTYGCTAGFNWKMWSTSEIVGSTASHCDGLDYYNGGQLWGHGFLSDPIADALMLRSGQGYSATVYVGGVATTDYRIVKGFIPGFAVGQIVALSGATTGLSTAYVQSPNYTLPTSAACGGGKTVVLMDRHNSAPGDSGGPWLVTDSDGKVLGRGQHLGKDACGTGNSVFVPLNTISARLGASLLMVSS